jgi:cell division protein FtsN
MARREAKPARREEPRRSGGKPGGLFVGLVLGLVIGLLAAAGLAWYFNRKDGGFKQVDQAPNPLPPVQPDRPFEPLQAVPPPARPAPSHRKSPTEPKPVAGKHEKSAKTGKAAEPSAPIVERKPAKASEPTSRVPLTFYGILPGEKPAKPVEPPKPKDVWWLQVAALKNPADADKLKARLSLLGLEVSTQQVESAGQTLYRVRVGPYKRDEDAFADLDTMSANNYEPRLLKEPLSPSE